MVCSVTGLFPGRRKLAGNSLESWRRRGVGLDVAGAILDIGDGDGGLEHGAGLPST